MNSRVTNTMHACARCVISRSMWTLAFLGTALQSHGGSAPRQELLVKWTEGPTSLVAQAGNAELGSVVVRNFSALGWQLIQLRAGLSVAEGMAAYEALGGVIAVEANSRIEGIRPVPGDPAPAPSPGLHGPAIAGLDATSPDDPLFDQQWYLRNIRATNAWAVTTGSSNVVVAVIDTGVDYTHPDLVPNMWRNPGETGTDERGHDRATNGLDDDRNGFIDDVHGISAQPGGGTGDPMDLGFWDSPRSSADDPIYHGTFIAGLIGALANNGLGIAGLNHGVRIMAVQMPAGDRASPTHLDALRGQVLTALDYVLEMKRRGVNVRITNHSWVTVVSSAALRDAFAAADAAGILSVCAAGNAGVDLNVFPAFPAAYQLPGVISVAMSNESDTLDSSSSYGGSTVHLAAPGVNMTSTWGQGTYRAKQQGSSFAAPLVAATAALLLAVRPDLSADEVKAALLGSVDRIPALRGRVVTGGRLNAARALDWIANPAPPSIVISAQPAGQRTPMNAAVQVRFNQPMKRESVEAAFSISPHAAGTFVWAADNRSFRFTPEAPFDPAAAHTVRLLGSAEDEAGGTLDGNYSRSLEGSPTDDFSWTFRFPTPRDDFATAEPLSGESGSVTASNRYGLIDEGEPLTTLGDWRFYGQSVWYRWTAPRDGWFTFDLTAATTFDSLLIVYRGERLDQLIPVTANDNYGARRSGRVSFQASGGFSYTLAIASRHASDPSIAGSFTLRWNPTSAPQLTLAGFTPTKGAPGTRVTLTGTNLTGATAVLFNGARADVIPAPAENEDLRVVTHVPSDATSGPITLVTPHGSVTSSTEFSVLPSEAAAPAVRRITALAAAGGDSESVVTVVFDQPLEPDSAQNPSNYVIAAGAVAVRTARLQDDWRSVVLTTGALLEGAAQSMTVRGIANRFHSAATATPVTHSFEATHQVLAVAFDDPADPGVDTTGNARSAFVVDNPQTVTGAVGSALRFDGLADYLEVPYSRGLGIGGDITIAAWVRREAFGEYGGILAKTSGALDQWDYVFYFPAGSDTLRFWSDGQHPLEVASTGSVTSGTWHHVAITRSGDTVSFFINGRESGSATVTGRMPDRQFPVRIGTDGPYYNAGSMYRGQLDDVRLYSTALSEAAIRQLAVPALVIRCAGTEITLSWAARGVGLVLEESEDLRGSAWSVVTRTPTVRSGQNELKLAAPAGIRFFRLRSN